MKKCRHYKFHMGPNDIFLGWYTCVLGKYIFIFDIYFVDDVDGQLWLVWGEGSFNRNKYKDMRDKTSSYMKYSLQLMKEHGLSFIDCENIGHNK